LSEGYRGLFPIIFCAASQVSAPSSKRRSILVGLGSIAAGALAFGAYNLLKQKRVSDKQTELQEERRRMIQSIKRLETAGLIDRLGTSGFLAFWNDSVLARLKSARFPADRVQAEILRSGTIFRSPATRGDIAALEKRLSLRLPPSLTRLFEQSNGIKGVIEYANEDLDFFPCNRVAWLHELDRQLVEIWTKERFDVSDAEYSRYGQGQNPGAFRSDYLKHIVALGPVVDGGVFLLNPQVPFPDGELEAWDFSVKHPGAIRYRSPNRLLEVHCADDCWNLEYWSISHEWQT
jgi:hypothetical protein